MMTALESHFVDIEGMKIHYLAGGSGEPVLLLHGFPTSAFLYRHIAPAIAERNRVIVLDLPGFGKSDKPLTASYSFRFFGRVLYGLLDHLNISTVGLTVHDLGGPIGLYWACQNPQRITKLALLNTLVYPQFSWAVVAFVLALRTPGLRWWLTSPQGLKFTLSLGISDAKKVSEEAIQGIQAPFVSDDSRKALIKAGIGLHRDGFKDIGAKLPAFKIPVRIVYGRRDRILPDVARTMHRVKQDLPQAEVTVLESGHFLQEECPDDVSRLLAAFFGG